MDTEQAVMLAAVLCRRFEGLRVRPYLCPAGVPTIGYGSTRYLSGRRVLLSDQAITAQQADQLLLQSLRTTYLPAVITLCPGVDTDRRLAAVLDWTYNLGVGNLRASTLRRRINAGRWADVPREIKRWNMANGQVLPGLVARRAAEAALI